MKKKMALPITIAVLGVLWIFAMITYLMVLDLTWDKFWGSLVCTIFAVGAAELYLLVFKKKSSTAGTEVGALSTILTICYLLIVLLLNAVFTLLRFGDFNWVIMCLNVIALGCYIVLVMWLDKSAGQVEQRLEKTQQKTTPSKEIARKLGELLAITEDSEIRGKLLKLKEAVDYSSNITTEATAVKDAQLSALLDEVVQLTLGRADRMIILNKVETAEMTWKMRMSAASSVR